MAQSRKELVSMTASSPPRCLILTADEVRDALAGKLVMTSG